ncbi:MAG TPA: hypothetical protein PKM88_13305, partial [bacterium]|nr:hypothetical protein [bacterium]
MLTRQNSDGAAHSRMQKCQTNPIGRGIGGGLVGIFAAVFITFLFFCSAQCPEWSAVLIVGGSLMMGGLGVLVGGIPSVAFAMKMGFTEKYRSIIPRRWL